MKKTLSILALSSNAFAADRCAPEAPTCYTQDSCERCYCLGPAEVIANAPVGPVTCDGDVSLTVAGLYWRAEQEGLEYAVDTAVRIGELGMGGPAFFVVQNLVDAEYLKPNSRWDFGFKLGLAYTSPCDGWDLGISWTHFQGKASSHNETERDDNHTIVSLWMAFNGLIPLPFARDIETSWKLDLDIIDVELGRAFWVSKYLSFRPHVGLRGAWIDQSLNLEHKGGTLEEIVFFVIEPIIIQSALNDVVDLENDYYGVGVRAGFETHWHLGCGWNLFGNLASALLYGHFDIDHDEYIREAVSPFTKTRILETEDHFRASRAMFDLALGIQYSALVCDCKYGLSASLAYEQHLFLHQNQLWRVTRNVQPEDVSELPNNTGENVHEQCRGNLFTQGITLTFQFDF